MSRLLSRLISALFAAWLVATLVFVAVSARPGDLCTTMLDREVADIQKLVDCRAIHGLDKPFLTQYFNWLSGMLVGDFGRELRDPVKAESRRNRNVSDVIAPALDATLRLGLISAMIAIPLAMILGIASALMRNRWSDLAISTTLIMFMTIPEFAIATILQGVFAEWLGWTPAVFFGSKISNSSQFWMIAPLPIACLSLLMMAHIQRLMRSSMIDALNSDFARTARLNGIPRWRIILLHCLPSALPPTISLSALTVGYLLSGVTVIESVFNYPGLGRLLLNSLYDQQTYLAAAVVLILALMYIAINFVADVISMFVDPRQRGAA